MKITLNGLTIDNFAGIKHIDFEFNNHDAIIYGDNATGKTTTAVALNWLLFGKTLDGKTVENVVPINEDGTENWEVVPTVEAALTIDGVQKTYRKESRPVTRKNEYGQEEYKNSRKTEQYIDDVSFKITDFNKEIEQIIDENIFKLITNIYEFSNLHWQKKRELLFDMTDDVTDDDVFKNNKELAPLKELLKDSTHEELTKKYNSQLKKSKEDLKNVPIKIDTLHNQIKEHDVKDYSEDIKALENELSNLIEEKIKIRNGKAVVDLKNEKTTLFNELKHLEDHSKNHNSIKVNGLKRELELDNSDVKYIEKQIKELKSTTNDLSEQTNNIRNSWVELNNDIKEKRSEEFEMKEQNVCECCGQELPEEVKEQHFERAKEEFNLNKSKLLERMQNELKQIENTGKRNAESLKANEKEIEKKLKQRNEIKESISVKENQLERLSKNVTDIKGTDEYKQLVTAIEEVDKKLDDIQITNDEAVAEIEQSIDKKETQLNELRDLQAEVNAARSLQKEIETLRQQEKDLRVLIEELQHKLYLLNEFTVDKVNLITDNVNSKFKLAKFKMFNRQVNGDLKETCEIIVDGVSFDKGLNNAMKINVALDIIETISAYYNTYAPIFVDNSESVTDVYETTSQQILLQVSPLKKHKKLEMEIKGDK